MTFEYIKKYTVVPKPTQYNCPLSNQKNVTNQKTFSATKKELKLRYNNLSDV